MLIQTVLFRLERNHRMLLPSRPHCPAAELPAVDSQFTSS